jgi:ribose transport system ATP-binding protein
VLDEPTSSLARTDVERLFELIRRLKQRGLALIYISHFLEEVRAVCDRFVVLRNGRSVGSGIPAKTSNAEIIKLMVGRDVEELYPRSPRSPGEPLLSLNALSGVTRPDQVTLTLHRGEVLGIAGIIGSGRTELLRAIFGLDPVRTGSIRVKAYEGPASTAQQWDRGVGMVSEDRQREGLALNLSIAENSSLSSLPPFIHPARQSAAARRWIDRLHIRCRHPEQPAAQLSGGNQQKIAVARLLEHDVDVFLLDEPTRGIDVAAKAEIYRLIDELACAGKAVLLVSSYLPELLGVCDRIAVMCKGRLHPPHRTAELDEHRIMVEATGFA